MDQLTEKIIAAAEVIQQVIDDARRRQDERGEMPSALTSALRAMQHKAWVDAHWPILWQNCPPGLWSKIVALYHKLSRRMLCWYINPIVRQQNEFNCAALDVLQMLAQEVQNIQADHLQEKASRQTQLDDLTARIERLQQILEERRG